MTGITDSSDFPTTPGAFDTSFNGAVWGDTFVVKLNAAGSALDYATFLGGGQGVTQDAGQGIAVDCSGAAYVTGWTGSSGLSRHGRGLRHELQRRHELSWSS